MPLWRNDEKDFALLWLLSWLHWYDSYRKQRCSACHFLDNITELVNTTNREECTFYAHGVCVSFIMERFRPDDTKCLPACTSFQFHMENLHVRNFLGINIIMLLVISLATPLHWEFSISILKNNFWVSPMRASIFRIWGLHYCMDDIINSK